MAVFQVRYWFETSSRDKSGEQITEIIESDDPHSVARRVQDFLTKDSFVITPSFGPATSGFVVVHTNHVRYVEIIPSQMSGAIPTAFASSAIDIPQR